MRRVAVVSGRPQPSMDGQRVRPGRAPRIRPLGDTVTYAPHRAPARKLPADGDDAPAPRWRTRLWVTGGVVVSAALIAFGGWAVTTSPPPALPTGAMPGGSPAGGFEVGVTGVRCGVQSVGRGGLEQRAAGQFCLLDVKVTNSGREP